MCTYCLFYLFYVFYFVFVMQCIYESCMLSFVVKHFVIFIWEKCYTNKFYLLTYLLLVATATTFFFPKFKSVPNTVFLILICFCVNFYFNLNQDVLVCLGAVQWELKHSTDFFKEESCTLFAPSWAFSADEGA